MRVNRRGMVLITVMFFILVIGLFGRMVLINGPATAQMANLSGLELQAQRAAEAGAAYARLKFRENTDWRGDDNATTVNEPDLRIEEQSGNVIGWIRGANGDVSMFRIRFNYQDGGGAGGDALPDPPPAFRIGTTFLSFNNIRGDSDNPVPDVNPSTFQVDDPTTSTTIPYDIPQGSALLRVEGLAGNALRDTTGPGSAFDPNGRLVKRTLRVIFAAAASEDIPEVALSAGNGIQMEVENGARVTVNGDQEARLRSKRGVDISQWNGADSLLTMDGRIGRDPSEGLNALVDSSGTVNEEDESVGDGRDFHNLSWDEVPKASTANNEAVQLPGGIYVATSSGEYLYYDMDLATFDALTPDASGIRPPTATLSSNFSEVRPPGNVAVGGISVNTSDPPYVLTIDEDVNFFESANGNSDVLFTTVGGRRIHRNDNTSPYEFSGVSPFLNSPGAMVIDNATISSPGDLGIMVDLVGENASITAENDTLIAAPSVALLQDEAIEFEQRLSIYAQGDLTVSTYRNTPGYPPYVPPYEGYNNLNLDGLVYAWGDANIYTGTPGEQYTDQPDIYDGWTLKPNYANVNLNGALVAYGADPSLFNDADPTTGPGSDGNGRISVYGMQANIEYDPTKLVSDPSALPAAQVDNLTRMSYGFEN